MKRFGLLLIGLCAVPPAALRADDAKENAAILGRVAAVFDGVKSETLPNGLRVYLKPVPGATTVTTMVGYKVGSADEEPGQTGLSHYLEHLMFKGTEKLMPGDIDRMTQRNGGRNNAYTSEDMTVYHFDFAADRWMQALDVEADRMRNLRIDEKHEFEQEKGAVISELAGDEDDAWDLEGKSILPVLFGKDTPYGHPVIGETAHVKGATAAIIKSHYDKWYHPNNAVLVVVGGFDEAKAKARIRELFGPIPSAPLPARKPVPKAPKRPKLEKLPFESKFETPRLLFGYNTTETRDPDDAVLDVIQHALTDGRLSRLYRELVDGDDLASSVSSDNATGRYPGWFSIKVELVEADDMPRVEKKVKAALRQIAVDGLTDSEFQRAKRAFLANTLYGLEEVHGLADLMTKTLIDHELDFLKTSLPKSLAVTDADVRRVARKYFVEGKGVVVESTPKGDKLPPAQTDPKMERIPPLQPAAGEGIKPPPLQPAPAAGTKPPARHSRQQAPQKAITADLSKVRRETLPNGLRVLLLENHDMPIVTLGALVRDVGMREPAEQFGIAHLLGNLFEEGTDRRTGQEIAELLEDRAIKMTFSANGGSLKVLSSDTATGIDVFFDCLSHPGFPDDEVDSQKTSAIGAIDEEQKKASDRARIEFYARAYGKHPFARSGLGNSVIVEKITPADLRAFHGKVYVPNNTLIAIAGDFDSAKVLDHLRAATLTWRKADLAPVKPVAVPLPKKGSEKFISDPAAAQLYVYLGHAGVTRDNPDFFKLVVLDNVLGVGPGFTDRLSANLRDRQGLAYSVNASITSSAAEQPGLFVGTIGTFNDKYAPVKEGFLKEINRLRAEAPTAEEVDSAKKYLIGSLPFSFAGTSNLANQLLFLERFGLEDDYFETYVRAIAAVTPDDVKAMAVKHLHPDKLIIVAAGAVDKAGRPLKKD